MNCNDVRENLIELINGGPADPQVAQHADSLTPGSDTAQMFS